ncbi:hypothetical protein CDD81_1016 [Ophiocordyceps australis]|uniref:RRM domain-containing protein n=1 Tax=Ophiocordyceps australis TaxID=1399860 RepID=A0A2C5X8A6_9HYPO|nr:hypothetical protein CDD81_1016 [Ophiocordyceps australis]
MANYDVEALLEATEEHAGKQKGGSTMGSSPDTRIRDGHSRERDQQRGRDRHRHRDRREGSLRSDSGSNSSRIGARNNRPHHRRNRDGDYYRTGRGRSRSRSRSRSTRRYRERDDRHRRDRRDGHDRRSADRGRGRERERERDRDRRSRTPKPNEDERDSRTVFVQQLANRLRDEKLQRFFEDNAGPVNEVQIVKDRVSGRSKGVGYVEFKHPESVQKALQLTGRILENIPIIVRLTEAEKNRQARKTDESGGQTNSASFHRLYIGNIHFNVTQQDLVAVFEPFGELEYAQLQMDEHNRSKGFGFVQYKKAANAKEALEKMNGFELAGRPIRVGLGNERSGGDGNRNHGQNSANFQGSAFSGAGGRGPAAAFDRAGGRDNERNGGGGALDDSDVAGVNFNNYSRDALMRKLARTDETSNSRDEAQALQPKTEVKPLPVNVSSASRCVVLRNMFDPDEEEGDNWVQELEEDVRSEAEKKYGHVVHIAVDANSKGDIYLKFDKVQGGENAIKGLNGRYFGGRMINASPVVDAFYSSMFSRARAI